MAPDWLIELYRKEYPNLTLDDVVELANQEWRDYEKDMEEGYPW